MGGFHTTIFLSPVIKGGFVNPVLTAYVSDISAALILLQCSYDLCFCKLFSFHNSLNLTFINRFLNCLKIREGYKGKECNLPEEYAWHDKDGNKRGESRIKWWLHPHQSNMGEFLFNCPEPLTGVKVPSDIKINVYPQAAPPVFFGHYWLEDRYPVIQAANVICLDYSVAKNGSLVAYRWSGEEVLDNKHFVSVV